MGSKHHLNPRVVFFFEIKIFSFPKKLQVLVDPVVVNFLEMHLIQHLYFFSKIVKKITTTGSSLFISPNGQGSYLFVSGILGRHIQKCFQGLTM